MLPTIFTLYYLKTSSSGFLHFADFLPFLTGFYICFTVLKDINVTFGITCFFFPPKGAPKATSVPSYISHYEILIFTAKYICIVK